MTTQTLVPGGRDLAPDRGLDIPEAITVQPPRTLMNREQWRALCTQELGKPYIWGAEGPQAYDCSGFAQWALKHLNLDPPSDQTADGLFRFFGRGRSDTVTASDADVGDLIFFGSDEAVTHVGLGWGGGDMIEAGGGGRSTTTVEAARRQHAEVRIRPIARRRDLVAVLRPRSLPWYDPDAESLAGVVTEATGAAMPESAGYGRYTNAPPLTEWLEDGRHMRLKRPFGYVEESGHEWPVPTETLVDGASIPQVFWSLIGGPFEGRYRDASIVHDYYCDVRTRPWDETHRVFYDAMRCSGVGAAQAKTLYYAVYRFGPRWTQGPAAVAEGFGAVAAATSVPTALPVEPFDAASFAADAELIRNENLDTQAIEALADGRYRRFGDAAIEAAVVNAPAGSEIAATQRMAAEADAAFARRPLLQRLVDLQDSAADAASAESAGSLLARYSSEVRSGKPSEPLPEATWSFEQLKPHYESLYASCQIRPERAGEVAWHRKKLEQYRPRYEAVSAKTAVPWWFVGVVHALEASFNFNGHLHNGDPLSARTVQVPRGRPVVWNPPNDWESSALDALAYENLVGLSDWSVAAALFRWESYNGFGYRSRNVQSPYLWSFSNHYIKGKFVADGVFNANAVSKQCGAAVMLKALELAGIVSV